MYEQGVQAVRMSSECRRYEQGVQTADDGQVDGWTSSSTWSKGCPRRTCQRAQADCMCTGRWLPALLTTQPTKHTHNNNNNTAHQAHTTSTTHSPSTTHCDRHWFTSYRHCNSCSAVTVLAAVSCGNYGHCETSGQEVVRLQYRGSAGRWSAFKVP